MTRRQDLTGPFAFHELPPSSFPFTVEWISEDTGQIVHTATVTGAGALYVPPLADVYGPVAARVSYADGSIVEFGSDGSYREVPR